MTTLLTVMEDAITNEQRRYPRGRRRMSLRVERRFPLQHTPMQKITWEVLWHSIGCGLPGRWWWRRCCRWGLFGTGRLSFASDREVCRISGKRMMLGNAPPCSSQNLHKDYIAMGMGWWGRGCDSDSGAGSLELPCHGDWKFAVVQPTSYINYRKHRKLFPL